MKKKLLWFSDSPLLPTGYATISTQVCNRLATQHGWEIVYVSHNYLGRTLERDELRGMPYKLYGRGREEFCKDVLNQIIKQEQPSVFVTLLDTFMVFPWYIDYDFSPARTVFYFPSDGGGGLPINCENVLRRMTKSIAMSRFAQQQAKIVHNVDTDYIPHAVDSKHYRPFDNAEKAKLRATWGLEGKFVVGTVARNQGRKMMDRTIKAFAKWCVDKPEAVLLLHTDPLDPAAPWDIRTLISRYNIENRVVFTGTNHYSGWRYEKMPEVYNLMDVFLLTTSGEGWGVPTTEAMSCGLPVLVTDYTTTEEIVTRHNAGFPVKVAAELTGSWLVERAIMDDDDCCRKLDELYKNPELRTIMGANGRKAVIDEYDWDLVARVWDEKLTELIQW